MPAASGRRLRNQGGNLAMRERSRAAHARGHCCRGLPSTDSAPGWPAYFGAALGGHGGRRRGTAGGVLPAAGGRAAPRAGKTASCLAAAEPAASRNPAVCEILKGLLQRRVGWLRPTTSVAAGPPGHVGWRWREGLETHLSIGITQPLRIKGTVRERFRRLRQTPAPHCFDARPADG